MKQRIIAPEIIEALKEFDSPTVMNAIEKFEVRDRAAGYASMELKCLFPDYKPLVGYAFTATADTTLPGETRPDRLNEMLERIAQAPQPSIYVVKYVGHDRLRSCFAGDMTARTLQHLGAVGMVTDGGVRDRAGMAARVPGFQVFTPGLVVSHGRPAIMDFDVTVDICGLTIAPGDLLHGDENGMLTVPTEIADRLPEEAQKVLDVEAPLFELLKKENLTLEEILRAYNVH